MAIHHISLAESRPWSIVQYFMLYKDSPYKSLRIQTAVCLFGPWVIALVAFFMAFAGQQKRELHGAARFATTAEVRKAGLIDRKDPDKTILVGKIGNKYLTYGGYQFVLLAAPTRSGKGVGIVIPNCLNYSDSLVVLDIKLENFEISAGYRAAHGQEVFLFAPFDEEGRTHRYNPLDYISEDPASRIGDIDAVATALYSGGSQNDKFWSEQAKDLFRGLCLLVLETPELPHTLGEILRQASGKGKSLKKHLVDLITERQASKHPFSSACVDSLNRIITNSDNTLSGIVATFSTPLLIFQNPRVDAAMSASDFDLRDVRKKRMSIYLGIKPDKLKDASVIVNLFFDQLLNLNCHTLPSQDKSLKYQCLLILDEFTSIGHVSMVNQAVSYMAGYNMRLLTIIQNKSQLEQVYDKAGALTIKANHALMVMYAPSPVVMDDAKEYSEMLGYQTVKGKSKSKSTGFNAKGSSGSESVSDQRRALMLPQEIRELGPDREIVSLENTKSILCQKIRYYLDPVFTERANWPLPKIPTVDVGLHIAQVEDRARAMTQSDLKDPNMGVRIRGLQQVQVAEEFADVNPDDMTPEQLETFAEDITQQVMDKVIHPAAMPDVSQSDEAAQSDVDAFFGVGAEGASTSPAKNTESADADDVSSMLSAMGAAAAASDDADSASSNQTTHS